MTRRADSGFSVAELLVGMSIMGIVLAVIFTTTRVVDVGGKVTQEESAFAQDISSPLHAMDKVLSQNKEIENSATYLSDGYQITARGPVNPDTRKYKRHIYKVDAAGNLIETVYQITWGSTPVKLNDYVWSTHNANIRKSKGQVFTYIGPSGETTTPAGARSVLIELWSEIDGDYMVGRRQVYFRNR